MGGPCRDSRPGGPLRSDDQTVMSSPVNRTALREEENRPSPASQQVIASAVTGPTPYSRAASTFAPVRCRAASSSWCRTACSRVSRAPVTSRAVATCSCPAGDRWAAAAARSAARPCPVRSAPSPRAGAPWWNKTAQLRLGGVLGPQVVIGLQQRPAFQDLAGRDPALRQPALSQQLPQVPAVGLIGLGVPLAAAGEGGVRRLGQMRRDAGGGQLLGDIPPPGTPLDRERDVIGVAEPRQPGAQVLPVGRADLAAPHLPGHGVQVVEGDLLPVDIQPAYDRHRDLLKLRGRTRPMRTAYAVHRDARLSWGGLPAPGRDLSSVRPDACHLKAQVRTGGRVLEPRRLLAGDVRQPTAG